MIGLPSLDSVGLVMLQLSHVEVNVATYMYIRSVGTSTMVGLDAGCIAKFGHILLLMLWRGA